MARQRKRDNLLGFIKIALVIAFVFALGNVGWNHPAKLREEAPPGLVKKGALPVSRQSSQSVLEPNAPAELANKYKSLLKDHAALQSKMQQMQRAKEPTEVAAAAAVTYAAPFTLAYALIGDSDGQVAELAVSLKSVFKNLASPPHGSARASTSTARIFLICDEHSSHKVTRMLSTELGQAERGEVSSGSDLNIEINTVIISAQTLVSWEKQIRAAVKPFELAMRHTFGTYIRLFLHLLIPPHPDMPKGSFDNFVIYSDTDVIFLVDPQLLFHERQTQRVVQFGPVKCAGLVLLNLARLPKLLVDLPELVRFERKERRQSYGHGIDDQMMLNAVEDKTPELVGALSEAWDGHLMNHGKKRGEGIVSEEGFALGILHFNGGGGNNGAFFEYKRGDWKFAGKQDWINMPGWNLAKYYVGLPWIWLRLHLKWSHRSGKINLHPARVYNGSVTVDPPVAAKGLPVAAKGLPVAAKGLPVAAKGVPVAAKGVPVAAKGLPVATKGLGACGPFRKYPLKRAYGVHAPADKQPAFLTSQTKYIRGKRPFVISPPKGRAKTCIIKESSTSSLVPQSTDGPTDGFNPSTATDGLNPSTVFFKKGHFLTLIGDSQNGDNQCVYPKLKEPKEGGTKRAMLVLQDSDFVTIGQVQLETRSAAGADAKHRTKHRNFTFTDSRLRWFYSGPDYNHRSRLLMISFYSGPDYGYETQLFQQLHFEIEADLTLKAAYVFSEETQKYKGGRNFAFFQVRAGDTLKKYYADWVLPPSFHPLESGAVLPVQRYDKPKIKVHGTSSTLVYIQATDEMLTIPHVHRPPGRPGATDYALHGHHYTHLFVTFDRSTLQIKRISNEFCFAATDLKTDLQDADCDMIQFASGLDFRQKDQKLAISWGINDCEGAVGLFDWEMINKLLLPVGVDGKDETKILANLFS